MSLEFLDKVEQMLKQGDTIDSIREELNKGD